MRRRWPAAIVRADRQPDERARLSAPRARDRPAVRHRRVRAQDGAALRPAARRVAAHDRRQGVLQADLSFLTAGPAATRSRGTRRVTLRPGLVLAAVFLCVYGDARADGGLPAGGLRLPERRGHLLHDGATAWSTTAISRIARRIWSGSGASFQRAGRRVPEEGADGVGGAARSRITRPRYYYGKSFIYPLCRGAVRRGCSAPTAFSSCTRSCWRSSLLCALPVPARARAGRGRRVLAAGFVLAAVGAGLLRLDHAGAVQLLAGVPGVFLLAL